MSRWDIVDISLTSTIHVADSLVRETLKGEVGPNLVQRCIQLARDLMPNATESEALIVSDLTELRPFVSVAAIAGCWAYVVLLMIGAQLALQSTSIAVGVVGVTVAVLLLGGAQHGLGILMHDAAHFRLFSQPKLNDLVSNFLLSMPLFHTTEGYRASHLAHHRWLNTEQDPDYMRKHGVALWDFPQSHAQWSRNVMKQAFGAGALGLLRQLFNVKPPPSAASVAPRLGPPPAVKLVYYATWVVVITALGAWDCFGLWMVAAFTVLPTYLLVRSVAEHFGLSWSDELTSSRNVKANWVEWLTVAPFNVGYHLDHHLYAAVPWFNLGVLHERLNEDPRFATRNLTNNYLSALANELAAANRPKPIGSLDSIGADEGVRRSIS